MDEYRDYTDEDIMAVAKYACDAALEKCKELGIDPIFGSIEGLQHAAESAMRAAIICTVMPHDRLKRFISLHEKFQIDELMSEAEEILGNE